jgi:hypothetical protein
MQRQVGQRFWREPGKLGTFISFALFLIAYGFYAPQQKRTLLEAVLDLVGEQLASVMPVAILTQWVLLSLYWVVFGSVMGLPLWRLMAPVELVGAVLLFAVLLVLATVSVWALFNGEWDVARSAFLAMFVAMYLGFVALSTRKYRVDMADRRSSRFWRARVMAWGAGTPEKPAPRWRPPPMLILLATLAFAVFVGIFSSIVFVVVFFVRSAVPSLAGVIRADLVICAIFLLVACYNFRAVNLGNADVPPALLSFIDLSLALSACAIALAGLPDSPVTLGSVPVWLVAVGPPLLVALTVFGLRLAPERHTPRWQACLLASAIGGVLVWPISLLINQWLTRQIAN